MTDADLTEREAGCQEGALEGNFRSVSSDEGASVNWFFWRHKKEWMIQPTDIHWNGYEASFIVKDGWELFGITPIPNSADQNQLRLWLRGPGNQRSRLKPKVFWQRKPYEIKIQSAGWGGHQVLLHLTEFWEPFGVSDSSGNHIIWFKRRAT